MTVDMYFPASVREIKPEPDMSEVWIKGCETILIVDDEALFIEVAREILETLGYRVLTTRSGIEAVTLYQSRMEEIDLVILDMIMSGMGGGETLDRLKSMDPQVKVILSSGYSLIGQAKLIMDQGCSSFIQKPFKIQELSQKIREVLDQEKTRAFA
ncbi:MAG: response regulator [Deltaproteobacteria bacterium]|nr:response regulator [Deltaproteobacteria bacterium]